MMQVLVALLLLCPLAAPTQAQDGAPLIFHGRVWVIEGGVRRAAQNGSIRLNAQADLSWRDAYDVDVKDGRFRQIVRLEHERYWVGKMQLEGREALCTWHAPRAVLSDAIELEARFLPISRVRVRLRDSGEVLSSCEMDADHLTAKPRSMELPQLVSPWRADEYDAPWQLRRTIRARAPGTAWGTAVVDLEAGGDFWIDLVPEAKLRVSVFVPPDVPQQQLRLVSDGGEMESDWNNLTHDGQLIAFDGLAEGSYAVETRSRHSDWAKQAQRAEIHLCENETRELLLDLDCLAAVPRALVRGSLTVDASWPKPAEPVQLSFLRKDPSTGRHALELRVEAVQDDSGTLAWDAGRLRLGRYAVVVEPYGCVSDLDLVVGLEPAALQVPPRWT